MKKIEVILFEPEIPPNTGNIARLCAALEIRLNLIEPLGFMITDKQVKRAGLDYWPFVDLKVWKNWSEFTKNWSGGRLIGTSARGGTLYGKFSFKPDDGIVFGPETRGLPEEIKKNLDHLVNIPINNNVRSINLATATGMILGEAIRQNDSWLQK